MSSMLQSNNGEKPKFFAAPAEFRSWFEAHHASEAALWVGFYKRGSGKPSITWPESVDTALCYGWIDGIRKSIDETSYKIRFTPRKRDSNWSAVNLRRIAELTACGLMHPAGQKCFEERTRREAAGYTYELKHEIKLEPGHEKQFKQNKAAWKFFTEQANWYQRTATRWVVSAKREETREKRLEELIADSSTGKAIKQLRRNETMRRK